jgi:hypothetical protein
VRVRPVGCCLRSDDTALLAEILRAKGLSKLGLSLLAPTVLSSAAPLAETLAALRAAGYAPVGENPDGSRAVEPTSKHRATRVPTPPPSARIHFSGTHGRLPESIVDLGWDELDEAAGYPFDAEILNPADLAMQLTGNRGTRSQMPST